MSATLRAPFSSFHANRGCSRAAAQCSRMRLPPSAYHVTGNSLHAQAQALASMIRTAQQAYTACAYTKHVRRCSLTSDAAIQTSGNRAPHASVPDGSGGRLAQHNFRGFAFQNLVPSPKSRAPDASAPDGRSGHLAQERPQRGHAAARHVLPGYRRQVLHKAVAVLLANSPGLNKFHHLLN